jgi:hypothetical protein
MTDSGDAEQWNIAATQLETLRNTTKILLVPGNHDLSPAFGKDPDPDSLTESQLLAVDELPQLPRLARLISIQSALFRDVRTNSGQRVSALIPSAPARRTDTAYREQVTKCAEDCSWNYYEEPSKGFTPCYKWCDKQWVRDRFRYFGDLKQSFPWVAISDDQSIELVSLASVLTATPEIGRNAIGLDNLQKLIESSPSSVREFVFLLHHPLTRPGDESVTTPKEIASWNAWQDSTWWASAFLRPDPGQAKQILSLIYEATKNRPGARAIVMFGHRHVRSLGSLAGIEYVEAPNLANNSRGIYVLRRSSDQVCWITLNSGR